MAAMKPSYREISDTAPSISNVLIKKRFYQTIEEGVMQPFIFNLSPLNL
jgi:hypothetical protein